MEYGTNIHTFSHSYPHSVQPKSQATRRIMHNFSFKTANIAFRTHTLLSSQRAAQESGDPDSPTPAFLLPPLAAASPLRPVRTSVNAPTMASSTWLGVEAAAPPSQGGSAQPSASEKSTPRVSFESTHSVKEGVAGVAAAESAEPAVDVR